MSTGRFGPSPGSELFRQGCGRAQGLRLLSCCTGASVVAATSRLPWVIPRRHSGKMIQFYACVSLQRPFAAHFDGFTGGLGWFSSCLFRRIEVPTVPRNESIALSTKTLLHPGLEAAKGKLRIKFKNARNVHGSAAWDPPGRMGSFRIVELQSFLDTQSLSL
jgi:hypothetical protein